MYWVKKRLVWVFQREEIRDKDNETGLKEGRMNRNVKLRCFPYTRLHSLSFALNYLPVLSFTVCTTAKEEMQPLSTVLCIRSVSVTKAWYSLTVTSRLPIQNSSTCTRCAGRALLPPPLICKIIKNLTLNEIKKI